MVWFQCEHCGENLKKPKLPIHFNWCPAYKLSCIDCGVVFDQQSVQAHSSCISEAEKYGPKGPNKGITITGPSFGGKNGNVQNGSDIDFSRGLSTSPPWSCRSCDVADLESECRHYREKLTVCERRERKVLSDAFFADNLASPLHAGENSDKNPKLGQPTDSKLYLERVTCLCNVKTTSQETLELHGQGKKHQSRAKAAAAKEKTETQGGGYTGVSADLKITGNKDNVKEVEAKDATGTVVLDLTTGSRHAEKKREKERAGEGINLTSTPSGNVEKKFKRGTSAVLGTSSTHQEDERLSESGKDPQDRKRKLVEEHLETVLEENSQLAGKKGRKKGKLAPREVNGHDNGHVGTPKVSGSTPTLGETEIGEQVTKRYQKDVLGSPVGNGCLSGIKRQSSRLVDSGLATELGSQRVNGKSINDKKKKKSEGAHEVDASKGSATTAKVQQDDVYEVSKKEKKKKRKEATVYEVSFREWLGEDDGTEGGTPTHPPMDINMGKENLEQLEGVEMTQQFRKSRTGSSLEGIARVVKWKKIVREVLCKLIQSLNGKLKRKDLERSVLPLAQKAIDSASISVDRKALKAELMRQVTTSSKFVVDGKHVMMALKV